MDFRQEVIDLLNGNRLDISPKRIDWTGYMAVYNRFSQAPATERECIIQAMIQIISEVTKSSEEELWRVVADISHLGYTLGIKVSEFRDAVEKLNPKDAPTDSLRDSVEYGRNTYLKSTHASLSDLQ